MSYQVQTYYARGIFIMVLGIGRKMHLIVSGYSRIVGSIVGQNDSKLMSDYTDYTDYTYSPLGHELVKLFSRVRYSSPPKITEVI